MVNFTQQSGTGTRGGRGGRGGHGRGEANPNKNRLTRKGYGIMLEWLEIPENFRLLNGGGNSRGRVGQSNQRVQTKKTVWAQMVIVCMVGGLCDL